MWRTRIYYGDTDAGNVVYYANYLRFFEKSWFEYLASRDLSLHDYEHRGVYFIVKRVQVDYHAPAKYGDIIEVDTTVSSVTLASFTFQHKVRIQSRSTLAAEGSNQMVCVTQAGKPRRLPPEFMERLQHDGTD
jgi:acyl-CoA thioester hydrolase